MRTEETKRMVEITDTFYIADDGTKFTSKSKCEGYERKQKKEKELEEIRKMEIPELNGYMPLDTDMSGEYDYIWYRLNSQEDFDKLDSYFSGCMWVNGASGEHTLYPTVICIEAGGGYDVYDFCVDCYGYWLSDLRNQAEIYYSRILKKAGIPLSVMEKEPKKVDETTINYKSLACTIIDEFERDRMESGRSEIESCMERLLDRYQSAHDRDIIDDVLITLTGYSLKSLVEESEKDKDCE